MEKVGYFTNALTLPMGFALPRMPFSNPLKHIRYHLLKPSPFLQTVPLLPLCSHSTWYTAEL